MSRRSTGGGDPDPASSTRLLKSRHLAGNPFVSLAYIADVAKPAYADCRAEWVNDSTLLRHVALALRHQWHRGDQTQDGHHQ